MQTFPFPPRCCVWCWYEQYPSVAFPAHWTSTMCEYHAVQERAKYAARKGHHLVASVSTFDESGDQESSYGRA